MPDGATQAGLPELWAGVECTVNRVGDRWFDQLARSGHFGREDDLDRIADLGVRALRYPVLWEHVAPRGLDAADWGRADAGLARLRARGVRPIVGLVHHGSGPAGTALVDPSFPVQLAAFAGAVARRYPWLEAWTPVNEPVTTARFSGLYGHWYPHGRDDRTFVRALLGELRATVLAMEAIRAVIPGATLVQTEDVGRTTSTAPLSYQADFDNARRWLGFDLLCGRVDGAHPLHGYLLWAGATEAEFAWFRAHPTPPDVIGLNYYVTSDRHLDERLARYPAWSHGGNGRDAYADVEAARVPAGIAGHGWVLAEAWRRYGLPVALTEVHLGGGREDQLRWLAEGWDAAAAVRGAGVDVRGVTVWSVLGAFDWNSLVTADRGYYEPGPFDVRAPRPRPTALAAMTRALARGARFEHPALAERGWWRRPDRVFPGCAEEDDPGRAPHATTADCARPAPRGGAGPAILVLGGRAGLGEAFARACAERGLAFARIEGPGRAAAAEVAAALARHPPWAVVNAWEARPEDPPESEELPDVHPAAAELRAIAEECARRGVRLASLSSDLVFDGDGGSDRSEADPPARVPAHPRGRRELAAERAITAGHPGALLVRTGAWFAPWRPLEFLSAALEALDGGATFAAADDRRVSLTYGPDLAHTVLDLLFDGEAGPWHLVHPEPVSWAELARAAARRVDLDPGRIIGVPAATLGLGGPRPHRPLTTIRGALLAPLESALERYLRERVVEAARVELAG